MNIGAKVILPYGFQRTGIPKGAVAELKGWAPDLIVEYEGRQTYLPNFWREKTSLIREASPEELEFYTCPICGEDDFKFSEFDHKEDMCYGCIEDGASEEMENWLRADYNSRCTL